MLRDGGEYWGALLWRPTNFSDCLLLLLLLTQSKIFQTKEAATERNSGGEVAMQNDQPFDFIGLPLVSNHLSSSSQPEGYSMISRDERSSLQPPQANYQALLMRAMGANRYIQQQLAPGQAQMSLDSLFGSGKERTNSAGGVLHNQDKSGGQEQKFQSD